MKKFLFMLIALLPAFQGARADNVAQAIWCDGNTTLYFDYCATVTEGSTYNGKTATKVYTVSNEIINTHPAWNLDGSSPARTAATTVVFQESFKSFTPKSCYEWFFEFRKLTKVEGLANLNTSQVEILDFMFDGCIMLENLDVNTFDVSKVTTSESMFLNCSELKTIYCNKAWNIENTASMFYGATQLRGYNELQVTGKMASPAGYFTATQELSLNDEVGNETTISDWVTKHKNEYANVKLNECTLFKDTCYNTLCLPFSMNEKQIAESPLKDAFIRQLISAEINNTADTLKLSFAEATSITAGTPYIVRWPTLGDKVNNPVFNNVAVTSNTPTTVPDNAQVLFVGQYSPFEIVESGAKGNHQDNMNEIILLDDLNGLYYSRNLRTIANGKALRSFCAHFRVSDASSASFQNYEIDFGDGAKTKGSFLPYSWDGNGDEASPYLIISTDQLKEMAEAFNDDDLMVQGKYFKQAGNIAFDKTKENDFTPVKVFKGSYDGDGYIISGVNINKTGTDDAALFLDLAEGSKISNIIVKDSRFQGSHAAAISCHVTNRADILNCHVLKDVTVTSNNFFAGSIAARLNPNTGIPTISKCTSQAKVEATQSYASGIVGSMRNGKMEENIYLGNDIHSQPGSNGGYALCQYHSGQMIKCYYTDASFKFEAASENANPKLMPVASEDNTTFLSLLHERDEYLLQAGLTKEDICYDLTINGREYKTVQNADGTWNRKAFSISLPFDMEIPKEQQEEVLVYKLSEIDTENKTFVFTNDFPILKAGEPYILVVCKGSIAFNGKNVLVKDVPMEPQIIKNTDGSKELGCWRATFKRYDNAELVEQKAYTLQRNGTFHHIDKIYAANPCAAPFIGYFTATEPIGTKFTMKFVQTENGEETGEETDFPADLFDSDFDLDDETGIQAIENGQWSMVNGQWYDLQGRKLSGKPTLKGLYIMNGKKKIFK